MKTVNKSVLIWYSPAEMYALVTHVSEYASFLPWCETAQVLAQDDAGMTAELGIAFGGIRQKFTTQNMHFPDERVEMRLTKGPFSKLEGTWTFAPVGQGAQRACRVTLQLSYGFESMALGAVVGPVFDKIASSLVDAFVKRAKQVYGD
ncbi:MAG: type II toxin-antitoxin system RatA family toxin [Rhodoferax sp.]|nr:type II toxin-antitoxin system RatA family toxin [Rhodoferax sp.]